MTFGGGNTVKEAILANSKFERSAFNAILYAWTPEVFPVAVRGTANGLASTFGRLR
jgi:hypothetical protein